MSAATTTTTNYDDDNAATPDGGRIELSELAPPVNYNILVIQNNGVRVENKARMNASQVDFAIAE